LGPKYLLPLELVLTSHDIMIFSLNVLYQVLMICSLYMHPDCQWSTQALEGNHCE